MAMGIWLPGGGGADVDVVTAEAGDVLEGKVIVGPDGEPLTGTLALSGNAADSQVLSGQTYYNTDAKTKRTGSMSNQGAWTSRLGANGKVTIPAGYHNGAGYVDQALPVKGAATYTPGRSNQTIGAGQYLTGAQTIRGDANLLAANIKKGVSIFGIIGSWEGFVTSPLYIYNNGTWSNIQSTGLTATTSNTELTQYTNGNFRIFGPSGVRSLVLARLNTAVNLSSYNYVNVNISSNNGGSTVYVGVSSASNITSTGGLVSLYSSTSIGLFKSNISSLSDNYFIYIGAKSNSNTLSSGLTFDQIYLSSF